MRDYATISAKFWIGDTGRKLRGDADAQRLCFYLMTCPSSNMIGLYYLPIPTLCHELGITEEGASKALRRVKEVGFASYDTITEWVWVHEMAKHQIGESLARNDNRVKSVNKMFSECLKCSFANEFHSRYATAFHLAGHQIAPQETAKPEAPSKPLRSQEQEQEQEQEQRINADSSEVAKPPSKLATEVVSKPVPRLENNPEPPAETALTFACVGVTKVYHLVQPQIDAWQADYQNLDVAQECRKAHNWIEASPRNRKTAVGMMKFLVSWLNRATDEPRGKVRNERINQAGLFGNREPDPTRVRTGSTTDAVAAAFAEAAAKRGE